MANWNRLSAAIMMAMEAHHNQLDKQGNPYILHPMRVMQTKVFDIPTVYNILNSTRCQTEDEQIVSILHDAVEDTELTISEIESAFGSVVADAIGAITHRKNESRDDYYNRIMANPIAHRVKLADISDNMGRISGVPDEATRNRLTEKYHHALDVLYPKDLTGISYRV